MSYLITFFAMLKKHESKIIIFDLTEPIKNTPECSLYQPVVRS